MFRLIVGIAGAAILTLAAVIGSLLAGVLVGRMAQMLGVSEGLTGFLGAFTFAAIIVGMALAGIEWAFRKGQQ